MKENIKTEVEFITPEIAREYLKFNALNRPLSMSTAKRYAKEMKNGEYKLNGETIIFDEDGNLQDGQHRLTACVLANVGFYSNVTRGVSRDAFFTIDKGRNRSTSDIFSICGVSDSSRMSSIVCYHLKLCKGKGYEEKGVTLKSIGLTPKYCVDYYESNKEMFIWARLCASRFIDKLKIMRESEEGGIMTYLEKEKHYPRKTIEDFFYMLHYAENVTNGTINLLRNKLINNLASNVKMTNAYRLSIIAKTWNAYIHGKELKMLSWDKSKENIIEFK